VLNRDFLSGGTEPPPTNSRIREEDVELPVDHVRIRDEPPRAPVEAPYRNAVGKHSDQEVLPRRFAEEQVAKPIATALGNPLVEALGNGIKSPTDTEIDVCPGGGFEEDYLVPKCL
jgi:hypothetical protein